MQKNNFLLRQKIIRYIVKRVKNLSLSKNILLSYIYIKNYFSYINIKKYAL